MTKLFGKIGKCIKTIAIVILSLLLLVNLLTAVISHYGLKETLNWMPCAFISIESGSMEPDLSTGDLVFVWRTPFERLSVGDVVTVCSGDDFVTHKICRIEENILITAGTRNTRVDAPVGEDEYCAKMVFAIPHGARVFEFISQKTVGVILAVFVALLFVGLPLIASLYDLVSRTRVRKRVRIGAVRILSAALVISTLLLTPFMTYSRYVGELNGTAFESAGPIYFSSNYLSEGSGTNYRIQGWNGATYIFELKIKNETNILLYNRKDTDVPYHFMVEKISGDGLTTDYDLSITPTQDTYTDSRYPGSVADPVYTICGDDASGQAQTFNIQIEATRTLELNEKISFRVIARPIDNYLYDRTLTGVFTLEVADNKSFLGFRTIDQSVDTSIVNYTMKTNIVPGGGTRNVVLVWDTEDIFLNEYDITYINLMARYPDCLSEMTDTGTGKTYQKMTIPFQSFSNLSLQFFKYADNMDIILEDVATEYEDWAEIKLVSHSAE